MNAPITTVTGERADLLQSLRRHREFLLFTVKDLTDEQAASRPTVSELCLGGLIKHVGQAEKGMGRLHSGRAGRTWWGLRPDPVVGRDATGTGRTNSPWSRGETLAGIVSEYEGIAARTDELVASLDSLDISHPLPSAPWFEAGSSLVSARAHCCTSSPRRPSMRATRTCFAKPSTVPRRWVDGWIDPPGCLHITQICNTSVYEHRKVCLATADAVGRLGRSGQEA